MAIVVRCPKIAHRIIPAAAPSNRIMVGVHILERNPQLANLTGFLVALVYLDPAWPPILRPKELFPAMSDIAGLVLEEGFYRRFFIDLLGLSAHRCQCLLP